MIDNIFEIGRDEALRYTSKLLLNCPKRLRPTWEDRYEQLVEFKSMFGHTDVPYSKTGLGRWVSKQREIMRRFDCGLGVRDWGKGREKKLLKIGFEFNPMNLPDLESNGKSKDRRVKAPYLEFEKHRESLQCKGGASVSEDKEIGGITDEINNVKNENLDITNELSS